MFIIAIGTATITTTDDARMATSIQPGSSQQFCERSFAGASDGDVADADDGNRKSKGPLTCSFFTAMAPVIEGHPGSPASFEQAQQRTGPGQDRFSGQDQVSRWPWRGRS